MSDQAVDGAVTALHRRIEELTAELTEAMRSGEVVAGLLATERTAREQAERESDEAAMTIQQQADEMVRLRSKYECLRADLLAARAGLDKANEAFRDMTQRALQAERERDAALARAEKAHALVKSTEAMWLCQVGARKAAETALASARTTIGRVAEYVGYLEQDIAAARKNREPQAGMHVPYHGAFCSAPVSTIRDLERFARSMRELLTSHPSPAPVADPPADKESEDYRAGYLEGLDDGVREEAQRHQQAQSLGENIEALRACLPVAAPCAGCASARELLHLVAGPEHPDVKSWLKEHP